MPARSAAPCIRCRQIIEINESALVICLYVRTVGIGEALRSNQEQVYVCSECSVAMVMGDEPPKTQPLNLVAYNSIRKLIGSDPAVVLKAWNELRKSLELPAIELPTFSLAEPEILPPANHRALKAAS